MLREDNGGIEVFVRNAGPEATKIALISGSVLLYPCTPIIVAFPAVLFDSRIIHPISAKAKIGGILEEFE